jgi:competence protein ComFB
MGQVVNYSSVYNFYEHLVFNCISTELRSRYEDSDDEFFLDVACYALTCLPSRYIRHEVDMAYYLVPVERAEMTERVKEEVIKAAELIHTRQQKISSE